MHSMWCAKVIVYNTQFLATFLSKIKQYCTLNAIATYIEEVCSGLEVIMLQKIKK